MFKDHGSHLSERIRTVTANFFGQMRATRIRRSCRGNGIRIAIALLLCTVLYGQKKARFDVVSIKRNVSKSSSGGMKMTADGFWAVNIPFSQLVYGGVNAAQVIGAPKWLASERYDVIAKVDGGRLPLTANDRVRMIRSMLQDRLQLRDHREIRERPIFQLTVVKGGAKLKPAAPSDDYAEGVKRPGGAPAGAGLFIRAGDHPGERKFVGQDVSITELARQMSYMLDLNRLVVDATALKGRYDFTLNWVPMGEAGNAGPSLFAALEEQLGLRLVSTTGPVEVLVIDHIERPSAN